MLWLTAVPLLLVLASGLGQGRGSASDSQIADPLYVGLPPQQPNSVRLGVQETADIAMRVSIKRQTLRCDDLEGHVQVVQAGLNGLESYACFGVERPSALTQLVVGQGAARHYYRITFEYARPAETVTYTIRRVAGAGIIESQQVVVDVKPLS